MDKLERICAEIQRRRKAFIEKNAKIERGEIFQGTEDDFNRTLARYGNRVISQELFELLCFIESLEKEQDVDLEKEIEEVAMGVSGCDFCHESEMIEREEWCKKQFRHFYDLGINAKNNAPKIKGWVARNPNGEVFFSVKEPHQVQAPGKGQRPHYTIWDDEEHFQMYLPKIAKQLPDEPIEVELTISRVVKTE